ncbi:hypothetical protein E2C01_037306 [Portunus trituberculatus]|uniref:Uncharacterized protein n=1 Tax=Portunus trituberculatus TaxID=210409 RepID=A0A5B7FEZ2_PORTR|nr:hypothetical protein [Portunus trituberculatus]
MAGGCPSSTSRVTSLPYCTQLIAYSTITTFSEEGPSKAFTKRVQFKRVRRGSNVWLGRVATVPRLPSLSPRPSPSLPRPRPSPCRVHTTYILVIPHSRTMSVTYIAHFTRPTRLS